MTFNPEVLPLTKVFKIFFTVHDPTTLNRQVRLGWLAVRGGVFCSGGAGATGCLYCAPMGCLLDYLVLTGFAAGLLGSCIRFSISCMTPRFS